MYLPFAALLLLPLYPSSGCRDYLFPWRPPSCRLAQACGPGMCLLVYTPCLPHGLSHTQMTDLWFLFGSGQMAALDQILLPVPL